jgi:hypothetical protein
MKELDIKDIIKNITSALECLDGDEVAEVHNFICANHIEYVEDSIWKYKE